MAKKRVNCQNLLKLFDEVEKTHQSILQDILRALKIHNDEAAVKRILNEIREKLI